MSHASPPWLQLVPPWHCARPCSLPAQHLRYTQQRHVGPASARHVISQHTRPRWCCSSPIDIAHTGPSISMELSGPSTSQWPWWPWLPPELSPQQLRYILRSAAAFSALTSLITLHRSLRTRIRLTKRHEQELAALKAGRVAIYWTCALAQFGLTSAHTWLVARQTVHTLVHRWSLAIAWGTHAVGVQGSRQVSASQLQRTLIKALLRHVRLQVVLTARWNTSGAARLLPSSLLTLIAGGATAVTDAMRVLADCSAPHATAPSNQLPNQLDVARWDLSSQCCTMVLVNTRPITRQSHAQPSPGIEQSAVWWFTRCWWC